MVGGQTVRQAARLAASGARAAQRRDREERDRRLERLAVEVITAVGERDTAIAATEDRAGQALRRMVDVEGVSVAEAVEWCAGTVNVRDAARLRRLVGPPHETRANGAPGEAADSGPTPVESRDE